MTITTNTGISGDDIPGRHDAQEAHDVPAAGNGIDAAALAVLDVDGKLDAVRRLDSAKKHRDGLLAQLEEAERLYGAEHAAAVRAGWAGDQLARLGFAEPTRRPRGRPRTKAISRSSGGKPEPPNAPAASAPEVPGGGVAGSGDSATTG